MSTPLIILTIAWIVAAAFLLLVDASYRFGRRRRDYIGVGSGDVMVRIPCTRWTHEVVVFGGLRGFGLIRTDLGGIIGLFSSQGPFWRWQWHYLPLKRDPVQTYVERQKQPRGRDGRWMRRGAVVASLLTALLQQGVTKQDYFACIADAARLCRSASNLSGVASCLASHRESIKPACRAALGRHGM